MDRRKVTFLDVLIECDQKTVVSNAAVRPRLETDGQNCKLSCPGPVLLERALARRTELDWKQSEAHPVVLHDGRLSARLDLLLSPSQHQVGDICGIFSSHCIVTVAG